MTLTKNEIRLLLKFTNEKKTFITKLFINMYIVHDINKANLKAREIFAVKTILKETIQHLEYFILYQFRFCINFNYCFL